MQFSPVPHITHMLGKAYTGTPLSRLSRVGGGGAELRHTGLQPGQRMGGGWCVRVPAHGRG